MLRASSLPALAQCPCFESGSTDWTEAGTDRHVALEAHFAGDDSLLDLLEDEDREGVLWAADYIRQNASTAEYPLIWERRVEVVTDEFHVIPGTPDIVCHLDIFDLKWRTRDYTAQMALYAAARLEHYISVAGDSEAEVTVHLLFGATKRAVKLKFSLGAALAIIEPIAAAASDPRREETPCSYCSWCARQVTCTALNKRAQAVNAARDDWQLATYHASEIATPVEMAKALALARHLSKWAEAVEHFAKKMAIQQGVTIPGYELKSKAGKSSCADVKGAFDAAGLEAEDFLKCCELRFKTSKDNTEKKGLADIYAEKNKISKAAALRHLKVKLAPYLRTPKDTKYLKAINSTEEEEEQTHA